MNDPQTLKLYALNGELEVALNACLALLRINAGRLKDSPLDVDRATEYASQVLRKSQEFELHE